LKNDAMPSVVDLAGLALDQIERRGGSCTSGWLEAALSSTFVRPDEATRSRKRWAHEFHKTFHRSMYLLATLDEVEIYPSLDGIDPFVYVLPAERRDDLTDSERVLRRRKQWEDIPKVPETGD
jgi:hypothetical protein